MNASLVVIFLLQTIHKTFSLHLSRISLVDGSFLLYFLFKIISICFLRYLVNFSKHLLPV